MPTQRITVAKITGDAAIAATLDCFQRWHEARIMLEEDTVQPADWPKAIRAEVAQFVAALREASSQPPVCFYLEYVDMWSCGYVFEEFVFGESLPYFLAASDDVMAICYSLPDDGKLLQNVETALRRKQIRARNPQETRWYLQFLLEAIHAWDGMTPASVVIVVREVLAALVSDDEFLSALDRAPTWLSNLIPHPEPLTLNPEP